MMLVTRRRLHHLHHQSLYMEKQQAQYRATAIEFLFHHFRG
jgi:hypothetical protein